MDNVEEFLLEWLLPESLLFQSFPHWAAFVLMKITPNTHDKAITQNKAAHLFGHESTLEICIHSHQWGGKFSWIACRRWCNTGSLSAIGGIGKDIDNYANLGLSTNAKSKAEAMEGPERHWVLWELINNQINNMLQLLIGAAKWLFGKELASLHFGWITAWDMWN
jgi:hypothetical protein